MLEEIKQEMKKKGIQIELVDIGCLNAVLSEVESLNYSGMLDTEIYSILKRYYTADVKEVPFEVKSVLIAASPCKQAKILFHYKDGQISAVIPPTYIEYARDASIIEDDLNRVLSEKNFHALLARDLPAKIIAARCGLSVYGRNNISYVPGMGSFALLSTYFSDLPFEGGVWKEAGHMDQCGNCKICVACCPTGALSNDRYLIKAERCLTYLNEFTGTDFPVWVKPEDISCIIGCMHCQSHCPANRGFMDSMEVLAEFNEEETGLLMNDDRIDTLPDVMAEKLERLNLLCYTSILPRNIRALLKSANASKL